MRSLEKDKTMWHRPRMRPCADAREPVDLIGGPSPPSYITETVESIDMSCPSPDPGTNWMETSGSRTCGMNRAVGGSGNISRSRSVCYITSQSSGVCVFNESDD